VGSAEDSGPMHPASSQARKDEAIAAPQHEVQRKLGRSMLQFQLYEQLLKALLVHLEVSGTVDTLPGEREKRAEKLKLVTLGNLVASASRSLIRTSPLEDLPDPAVPPDKIHVHMRINLEVNPNEAALIEADLRRLVELRNGLVHHLIERFDVFSIEGCHAASAYLDECYVTIKAGYTQLRAWAEAVQQLQQEAGAYIRPDAHKTLLKSQLRALTGATNDPT
jgi:hypothetical protein